MRFNMSAIFLMTFLLTSCATTSLYGTKSSPKAIGSLTIKIDDKAGSSELRDNVFLTRNIIERVTNELSNIGVKCITDQNKKISPSYILVLSAGGVNKSVHTNPVRTDINGNVSGGSSYTKKSVNVSAILLRYENDGSLIKIAQADAEGEGKNFFERQLQGSIFDLDKNLSTIYGNVFTEAVLTLFDPNLKNDSVNPEPLVSASYNSTQTAKHDTPAATSAKAAPKYDLSSIGQAMTQKLPMMIDKEMQLSSVLGVNETNQFFARYKMMNMSVDNLEVKSFHEKMFQEELNSSCTTPQIRAYLESEVIYNAMYFDKDSKYITEYKFSVEDCQRVKK